MFVRKIRCIYILIEFKILVTKCLYIKMETKKKTFESNAVIFSYFDCKSLNIHENTYNSDIISKEHTYI